MLFKVAWKSLLNRKMTVILTICSIAVSVFVLFSVEHIRQEAKTSFSKMVSGVDLIVGARTGQTNLLLYSIFHIGHATNNISWKSYQELATDPKVAWTIPISLGDSHKGYRVMGTSKDYFSHFKYGEKQALVFSSGKIFLNVYDAVLGAEVAKKLNYQVGDQIVLAHGVGTVSFANHDDKPFIVSGILNPTGTPVDQTLFVSLEGIEAIHQNWQGGAKLPGVQTPSNDLTPKTITAFMVGLKSKMATFTFQRQVNDFQQEPLLAILPGVALSELWQMMNIMEKILLLISILVLVAALLGMSTMLLASMKERQRELAIMRALGAHSTFVIVLVELEAIFITGMGMLLGLAVLLVTLLFAQENFMYAYGLFIDINFLSSKNLFYLAIILGAAMLLALIPSLQAYRTSLSVGLIVKN